MVSMEKLREGMADSEWRAAQQLFNAGQLRQLRQVPGLVEYMVTREPYPLVKLRSSQPSTCDCGEENCRHLAAAMMAAERSGLLKPLNNHREKQASAAFLEAVESLLPESPSLKLEPSLFVEPKGLSFSLRVGESRLYVVRHLPRFLKAIAEGESYELTHRLTLQPAPRSFSKDEWAFLKALTGYAEALEQGEARLSPAEVRKLPVVGENALRLLDHLRGLRFRLTVDGQTRMQEGIGEAPLPVVFYVSGGRGGITVEARMEQPCALAARDGSHIVMGGLLTRLPERDRAMARVLLSADEKEFFFPQASLSEVTGELLPTLMRSYAVVLDEKLERRMLRLPSSPSIGSNGEITATVRLLWRCGHRSFKIAASQGSCCP